MASLEEHYEQMLPLLIGGRVIPLLGAGANRCGRPAGPRREGVDLPDGAELAAYLALQGRYPEDETMDLVRVSQFMAVKLGLGSLYDSLHEVFDHEYPPTPLHSLLASLPALRRRLGRAATADVVVTTNYDDALERAFMAEDEPFDVVSYIAEGENAGLFVHRPFERPAEVIRVPNEYCGLALGERSVILKLHGAINRADPAEDSYVITEDDYIDYLTRTDLSGMLPHTLAAVLSGRHFLFLGYSLRDWNLRVILHRIWARQRHRRYNSWAVQLNPTELDMAFWKARTVEIFDASLDVYVDELNRRLDEGAELAAAS
jgi:hypothetical protein